MNFDRRFVSVVGRREATRTGCNHVSRLSKITIIQEIGKSRENEDGRNGFFGKEVWPMPWVNSEAETRKPRAVVLPRDRSALLLRRGRSKRKKAVRGRRLCPILARLPG